MNLKTKNKQTKRTWGPKFLHNNKVIQNIITLSYYYLKWICKLLIWVVYTDSTI